MQKATPGEGSDSSGYPVDARPITHYSTKYPPSMTTDVPVTYHDASDAR